MTNKHSGIKKGKDNSRLIWLEGETMDVPLCEAQEVYQKAGRKKREMEAARKADDEADPDVSLTFDVHLPVDDT